MSRRKKHPKRRPAYRMHHRRCPHNPERWRRVAPLDRKFVECTCAWDRVHA